MAIDTADVKQRQFVTHKLWGDIVLGLFSGFMIAFVTMIGFTFVMEELTTKPSDYTCSQPSPISADAAFTITCTSVIHEPKWENYVIVGVTILAVIIFVALCRKFAILSSSVGLAAVASLFLFLSHL